MGNRLKTVWHFITSPNYSRTVGILALLVVVLAIPLTVFIAQKQQEIRQRAQTIGSCRNLHPNDTVPPWVDGRGNPIDPNKYYWRALNCSENCFVTDDTSDPERYNSKCAKNTLDPAVNAATSNWCYRFDEGNYRCLQLRSVAQPYETCSASISCDAKAVNRLDLNNDLSCRNIGSSTNDEHEWITRDYAAQQCSETQIGRTALCGGQTYYCDGRPGGWTTTQPSAPTSTPTPTPTLTPAPTPVELCGKMCSIFRPGSIENKSECEREGYYIDPSDYNSGTKTCNFGCLPIPDYGTVNKLNIGGCGYSPIRPTSAPPPSGDGGDDGGGSGGNGGAPAPGPGVPAPTTPPTGALTKLLFDLILPSASKDKRIVAQIFTTSPTPTPSPTPPPDTTPTPPPTPTPTPAPNQIGPDLGGTVTRSSGGNHTGTVDVPSITSGTYDIKVKADKYLRKIIKNVQLTQATTNRISQITLVLGDINGDNKLNIADYNILIDCFGNKTCGNNKELADLDDNGRVDGVDYNLFLISLSKSPREGD